MRLLIFSIFLLVNLLPCGKCNAQTGTFIWTNGTPTTNPGASGSRFAVDRNTFEWYEHVSGTTWIASGDRMQRITGCSEPNYTPGIHNSKVVINGCDDPEIYIWNGTEWKQPAGGGGGSVSLPSQQIGFGTGSGITSDTALVYDAANRRITVKKQANTVTPSLQGVYNDASTEVARFYEMKMQNQTNYGSNGIKYELVATNVPNHNPGRTGNLVFAHGYNIGRPIQNASSLGAYYETNFRQEIGGITSNNVEYHVEHVDTLNGTHRIITARGSHDGQRGDMGFCSDAFYFDRYNATGERWLTASRYTGFFDFNDTMTIRYDKPMINLPLMQVKSADNVRYYDVLRIDAQNRFVFCPEQNDGVFESTNLQFKPSVNFIAQGDPINIGKIGDGSYISTTAPSVIVGRERTQTSGYWPRAIQDNNYEWYTPSFQLGMRMFSDAANNLFTMRGSKIGINNQSPSVELDVIGSAKITGANGHSQLNLATPYTPTSSSDTNGSVGSLAWDTNFIYVKTSAGWKRSALSTF